MIERFIFDVDGTLTPSRGRIDPEFEKFFMEFCEDNHVYLVTGSDRKKTLEQIGFAIYNVCEAVYQCSGNDIWIGDNRISSREVAWPKALHEFFEYWINYSSYHTKTGAHIDVRSGLLNFSIVGRNATKEQRDAYAKYDVHAKERENIARLINEKFDQCEARVAGETGIDITLKGCGKEQIIHDFSPHDKLIFLGDRMDPDGNDYKLSLEVINAGGDAHHVKDWRETWQILKS